MTVNGQDNLAATAVRPLTCLSTHLAINTIFPPTPHWRLDLEIRLTLFHLEPTVDASANLFLRREIVDFVR